MENKNKRTGSPITSTRAGSPVKSTFQHENMDFNMHWISTLLVNDYRDRYNESDLLEIVRIFSVFFTEVYKKVLTEVDKVLTEVDKVLTEVDKSSSYKDNVFDYLEERKTVDPQGLQLILIQREIENKTEMFDEKSIHSSSNHILSILIDKKLPNARDSLKSVLVNEEDVKMLSLLGHYTIEALIVHVLSSLYYSKGLNPLIRAATLIDRLESCVRLHASLHKKSSSEKVSTEKVSTEKKKVGKRSKMEKLYPIGTELLQFMVDRGLIELRNDFQGASVQVEKKRGAYYLPRNIFAVCNFDLSLLPVKLSLPMVCPPQEWEPSKEDKSPRYLSDLTGGYLSTPTPEIYRYSLLTSSNHYHFYISLGINYKRLCSVMNKLQNQPFRINSQFLQYIKDNEVALVHEGLLLPSFLSRMNLSQVAKELRGIYMNDEKIQKIIKYSALLDILSKLIQRSSYERFLLKLATAYNGYLFYLPVFLDFRGRIYRSGVLHFHERDLARSLILFAGQQSNSCLEESKHIILEAASFHFKSFSTPEEGKNHVMNLLEKRDEDERGLIRLSREAKKPFQFLSSLYIGLYQSGDICSIPITQDASASAYQLMSYFLLDETIAEKTNLIPSGPQIQDIYTYFLEDLKKFLVQELQYDEDLSNVVSMKLNRKIVKSIFMPLIYGKTIMSTAQDLNAQFSQLIKIKECYTLAKAIYKYWTLQCSQMDCLIRLVRNIGWIASSRESPLFSKVLYFTTVQDYHHMESVGVWVYDSVYRKRRMISLRVPTTKRDSRKTEISTFANFIHQKDAYVAMSVVEKIQRKGGPIYTVHDNFLTTAQYSKGLAQIYGEVICEMGPPLEIINEFIYMNLIRPIEVRDGLKPISIKEVFPKDLLNSYLVANIPDPDNMKKAKKKTWNDRILGILNSYEAYVNKVCGDQQDWVSHERKWDAFKSKLQIDSGALWHCVHY